MTKRAILVLGPEASGTRLATRILVKAGCVGDDNHVQRLDWWPPDGASPIVWRRSLPHMKIWPDLGQMIRELRHGGYMVSAVVTDRLTEPMATAQARDHVKNRTVARGNIVRARVRLGILDNPQGSAMPVYRLQYEDLVADPTDTIQQLIDAVGIPNAPAAAKIASEVNVYDGNAQYDAEEVKA